MHYSSVSYAVRNTVLVISVSLFIASSHATSLNDNGNVPLAIITSNAVELTPALIGRVVPADFISATSVSAITEHVEKVVVLVLPKLSFEHVVYDANYNGMKDTAFLSNALDTMSSVIYPAVSNIDHLLTSMGSSMTTLHIKSAADIKDDDVLNSGHKLQIILPPGVSLHDADVIFGQLVKLLNSSGHSFSILYTANKPDEWIHGIPDDNIAEEDAELVRYKRQTGRKNASKPKAAVSAPRVNKGELQDSNVTLIFYGDNCFEFYATSFNVSIRNTSIKDTWANATIPPKFRNATSSDANCTTTDVKRAPFNITLDYGATGNFTSLTVIFGVKMNNPWEWIVDFITLQFKSDVDGLKDGEISLRPSWLTAQVLFSYHCNNPDLTVATDGPNSMKALIKFGTVQAQAYDIADRKFGWQCDCVGFFTSAIWAGIVVSAIYLLIIALAIGMLVNLETMDRFEDPKGQQLKIQASG